MFQPILLVALCLASKQEAALRCFYGDTVLPGAIAVGASRQARGGTVTVVLVPQEHLTFGKGVLQTEEDRKKQRSAVEYRLIIVLLVYAFVTNLC